MYQPPKKSDGFLIFLMTTASILIVYGLYKNNPYFMNKKPLSTSLSENKEPIVPLPMPKIEEGQKLEAQQLVQRNIQRSYHENAELRIAPSYVREYSRKFSEVETFENLPQWTMDEGHFYLNSGQKFYKLDLERNLVWWFETQMGDRIVGPVTLSDDELFVVTEYGNIYHFDKATGQIKWMLPTKTEFVYPPMIYRSFLYYIEKRGEEEFYLTKMKGLNGDILWSRKLIGFTDPSELTFSESTKLILVTDPNGSLLGIDIDTGNAYWQKKKLGLIEGPATAVGDMAFVATTEGRAYGIHLRRKTIVWEYELASGSSQAFTYIPHYNYVAILTDNGYLHVIDGKTGEGKWRYNTRNEQEEQSVVATRLKRKYYKKYSLNRKNEGWVLLLPCLSDRMCFLNPDQGQLLTRIRLRGELASTPIFDKDKNIMLSLRKPQKLPWSNSKEPPPPFSLAKYAEYKPKPKPVQPEPETELE